MMEDDQIEAVGQSSEGLRNITKRENLAVDLC